MKEQNKKKIVLIGGGGHCRACIDVIRATDAYDIVGVLDMPEKIGQTIDGVPIVGTDEDLETFLDQVDEFLITVGQVGAGDLRQRLYQRVLAAGGHFATIVSPTATVAQTAQLGAGSIIMHNALVNAGAIVAENVIANSFSLIEHDAHIGAHTHISTRASINGGATIGENCFVGSHAVVFNHCHVGDCSVIGGGQVVRHNLSSGSHARDIQLKQQVHSTDDAVFVIAEAGVNHNGNLELAKHMIEVAAQAGADAVKFQTFRAEDLSTAYAEKAAYQKKSTAVAETQQDMLKALELPEESYAELVDYCDQYAIEFMSTAFDIRSMDFLLQLGIKRIKIPSGELTNVPLLRHCAKQGLPVILSTGMADLAEIIEAKQTLIDAGVDNKDLSILHCNTAYPTPFLDANLACIQTIRQLGAGSVGYSDHTLGDEAIIASIALGATIVEKHFTLDRTMPGPDQATSLEPDELAQMVERIRHIEQAMGDGVKAPTASELDNIHIARKSIVASQAIKSGEQFTENNVTTKRPGNGISATQWDAVLGQTATRDYSIDEQIDG